MDKNLLGTNVVTQIGILVHDIEATTRAYAEFFGVDVPEIIISDTVDKTNMEYKGKTSPARCRQSFFHVGGACMIELIEPDHEPSEWRDALNKNGEGVHHIAYEVEGTDEKIRLLEKNGMPLTQKGDYTGGRYAYIDSTADLKVMIELLENFKK
ncbi:VOC family protein [Paenibacillus abyssi]|uniref:Lactoylglutathione lyase n=1 Tax=Paenibacillus abyssi TaxID=1340531 RepID=A0A917G2A7_9BACL|nr:VOC family protein [Paenibacillus abyssi]GGG19311.1 lactoylglutathione lyase [Paenibacillus abyssi]